MQTPLYYRQLSWSQQYQNSYNPYDTSIIQTLGSVPLVSVLRRFLNIHLSAPLIKYAAVLS